MFHLYRGSCDDGRAFVEADRVLDRAAGPRWLSQPAVAGCVVRHILENDGSDYQVHAFVVMPNHVHVLLEPWIEFKRYHKDNKRTFRTPGEPYTRNDRAEVLAGRIVRSLDTTSGSVRKRAKSTSKTIR